MERSVRTRRVSPHHIDTLQKRIAQLELENQQLQAFQQISDECVFIIGFDGHLVSSSHQWEKVFGYSEMELQDIRLTELLTPATRFELETAILNLNDGIKESTVHCQLKDKGGNNRTITIKLQHVKNRDFAIGSISDETVQAQLERDCDQLKSGGKALQHELERFAYIASHDLQEPLRMISSFVQLIHRKYENEIDPATKKYIHFSVDGVKRMQALEN